MSKAEYNTLLYHISRRLDAIDALGLVRLICEEKLGHQAHQDIQDTLSLLKKLEESSFLGVDEMQDVKDILKAVNQWDLYDNVVMFESMRREYKELLERVINELEGLRDLERLMSIVCRVKRIPKERKNNIHDVRSLFQVLEDINCLGIDRLGILRDIFTEMKKDELLTELGEFQKRRIEDERLKRRKAREAAVWSSARAASQRIMGGVGVHCTFRTLSGVVLVVGTGLILRRCSTLGDFVEAFRVATLPAANALRAISEGSMCFTIQTETSLALEELNERYSSGRLQRDLQEFLVTDDIRQLADGEEVVVSVYIDEREFREARYYLTNVGQEDSSSTTQIETEEDCASPARSPSNAHEGRTTENYSTQTKRRSTEGDASLSLEIIYDSRSDFQKAIECYEKSLDIAREEGDRARQGRACFNLGTAYHSLSDLPKAIDYYEMSLNIARKVGDRATEGNIYFNLGNAYDSISDFPKAIECYEKSLNIARDAGDQGDAYLNLGIAYKSQGDFPKAIECYKKSLNIAREAGDQAREGDAYFNLGIAYKCHSDFPKAIECYEKSLNIAREAGDRAREGDAYFNLGSAHKSQGDFPKAIEYYEKSLNIAREEGDRAREGTAYFNLGIAYKSHRDFPKAIECYEKSLNIAWEAGDRAREGKTYLKLGIAFQSHSDFQKLSSDIR
ncbi:PREDICTED: tetratricopeptide repeat protein 28-like isoform X1 [Acropora digitifera]|uniref:tetratricopeptide repeat protein 28-like isoform X1 n=1 Tax=Acropora digitifera TaxID=70779 RepID=UPI00077AD20C|nr:PREDICTED: tetratricopeptide repeat protein 28-like isoform X1 [Acropora digitifera]